MKLFTYYLFLLCAALPFAGYAVGAYEVQGVLVELEGDNPEELRAQALESGKKEALAQLLQQMTPESDWSKHAWILADEQASKYIQSVSITDEQGADGVYSVRLNVAFDPVRTRKMLLKHKLNFSEARNNSLMLLPVWLTDGRAQVIDANPWYGALLAHTSRIKSELGVSYVQGVDLQTASDLKTTDIIGSTRALEQLAQAYPNQQIGLSLAEVKEIDGQKQLTVTTTFADARQTPIAFSYPVKGLVEKELPRAARELFKRASDQLVQNDVVRADQEQVLFIRYKAKRVQDIERMENALENLSVVADVSPRLISAAESVFMVHMYSDIPAFLAAAQRAGMTAEKQGTLYQVDFR